MNFAELMRLLASAQIKLELNDGKLSVTAPKGAMTKEIMEGLKAHKAALIEHLSASIQNEILPVSREQQLPLSFAQQRLWLLDKIEGANNHYNMVYAVKLKGQLDLVSLNRALVSIVERHECLRTCFAQDSFGQPYQLIQPIDRWQDGTQSVLESHDFCHLSEAQQRDALNQQMSRQAQQPFDLSCDLMLRCVLLKFAEGDYRLLLTMHHIASDGWSKGILIDEFVRLYSAFTSGLANPLAPLSIQYADYAHWQRHWLQGNELDKQVEYWREQLADLPSVHSLPLDKPRPQQQSFNGASYVSEIGSELTAQLNQFCLSEQATLFMGLHGVFVTLLARLSDEHDIVLGTGVANREQQEVAGLIGFFVNTLVLRADLSAQPDFYALLRDSKKMLLDAYAHQQVPFEQVVEAVQPGRSLSHSPLFQIMLVLQNNQGGQLTLPGIELSGIEVDAVVAKYDITLTVTEHSQGLWLGWEYNQDLFERGTIEAMAEQFERLLGSMLRDPKMPVLSVPMLSEAQQQQQLNWHDTKVEFPEEMLVHRWFEQQVDANALAEAVVFDGQSLSYDELNRRSNRLAAYLIQCRGVKPDTLIGICCYRSWDMVIAILAVLKAGGAYVPLDPELPKDRLAYMLDDGALNTVIVNDGTYQHSEPQELPFTEQQTVNLDNEAVKTELATMSDADPVVAGLTASQLAYVIYTSGSTGNPKGVMIEHRALVNRLHWMQRQYGCDSQDRILQKTPFSFDVSVWEFLWPLSAGATLVMAKPGGHQEPQYLSQIIAQQRISKLHFVPSMLSSMLALGDFSDCHDLRQVFCSGEALPVAHVSAFKQQCPQVQLHNLYGPTEAAIDVSYFDCASLQHDSAATPIGKPIDNIQLKVLDRQGLLLPRGAVGELYIGGVGLARGYLNRAELTAQSFVDDEQGQRWYKSGDLVRWLADGNLAYLGRIDHQVKIRGFRIELGEVEAALMRHAQVSEAVVVADHQRQILIAYVVTEDDLSTTQLQQTLSRHLAESLPEYMVPSLYSRLQAMPLSHNGKLNRKALPTVSMQDTQTEYVAPQTPMEVLLSEIWQQVLGLSQVGRNDSFFALGGHSLLVMQVVAQLHRAGHDISPRLLFVHHRLSELAEAVDSAEHQQRFVAPVNGIADDCRHITPDMLPLVRLSEAELELIAQQVPDGFANIKDIYPLGPLQQGILFHHLMHSETDPYVIPSLFKLVGRDTLDQFLAGLSFVIGRHDVLRTAILSDGLSQPVQVVYRHAELPVTWLPVVDGQDCQAQMTELCQPHRQWMDLTKGPLLRLQVGRQSDTEQYFVLLQVHHIVNDAVSHQILQNEIMAYLNGEQQQLATPVPYRDYIACTLELAKQHDAKQYFQQQLADVKHPSAPFGLVDVKGNGSDIVEVRRSLSPQLTKQIKHLRSALDISGAAFFHGAWALVVSAFSGSNDVVFGTVLSGRLQGQLNAGQMPGVFINTLPLRVKLSEVAAKDFFANVQQSLHQLIPFEMTPLAVAQRCSGLPSDVPLFSAMLNYRHGISDKTDEPEPSQQAAKFEYLGKEERTNYPFTLGVTEHQSAAFDLSLKVTESVDAEQLMQCIEYTVAQLVAALTGQIELPCVEHINVFKHYRVQEHHELGEHEFVATQYFHQYFEQRVRQQPDAVALRLNRHDPQYGAQRQLSYRQLDIKATRLSHYLRDKGVQVGDRVGLCVNPTANMIVAILAVLKAGAAYVPLEPQQPVKRSEFIVADADIRFVLVEQETAQALSASSPLAALLQSPNAIVLDAPQMVPLLASNESSPSYLPLPKIAQLPAYVIYTSGTTGQPKGVLTSHENLANFHLGFAAQMAVLDSANQHPWLWHTSFAFDASVKGLSLLFGGKPLVLATRQQSREPQALVDLMAEYQVDVFNGTPKLVEQVLVCLSERPDFSVNIISSGEDISRSAWQQVAEYCHTRGRKALNAYGPTEATINACYGQIDGADPVNIGRAMLNTQLFCLNEQCQPVPVGVEGELYIAGDSISQGYLNRDALNQSQFIDVPSAQLHISSGVDSSASVRLYRTGDRVKQLADQRFVYLGRIDKQVKLRGYRIELAEIEHQLMQLPEVAQAVVLLRAKANGEPQLAAFIVGASGQLVEAAKLEADLSLVLPSYCLPQRYVEVEHIPLTPSGKIDESALVLPAEEKESGDYVAPTNELESQLCQVIANVLQLERVGVNDNFVKLGGDSILSMQVVSQAKRAKIRIKVRHLFAAKDIAELATMAGAGKSRVKASSPAAPSEQVLLPIQQQFLAGLEGTKSHFNQSLFVNTPAQVQRDDVRALIGAIIKRHDVTRLYFTEANGQWSGHYFAEDQVSVDDYCHVVDMSSMTPEQAEQRISEVGRHYQSRFDVGAGKLLRAIYFDFGDTQSGKLLLLAHHLIVDGMSWRILMADLQMGYGQISAAQPLKLEEKTTSFAAWGAFLQQFAKSQSFAQQRDYWQQMAAVEVSALTSANASASERLPLQKYQQLHCSLDKSETSYLLSMLPKLHGNEVNEILLSAVYLALHRFSGAHRFSVMMEGHGREELSEQIDLSETLGWFTCKYPMLLDFDSVEVEGILLAAKQRCQSMPNRGIGYGLLRYMLGDTSVADMGRNAALLFNYLGSFDQMFDEQSQFTLAQGDYGQDIDPQHRVEQPLVLNGKVWQGKLGFSILFDPTAFTGYQAQCFSQHLYDGLRALVEYCRVAMKQAKTLDSAARGLGNDEFEQIVVPLSGSQAPLNMFCAPPIGGSSVAYSDLAQRLSEQYRVFGLNYPGIVSGMQFDSVEALATFYVALIKRAQPQGPYYLMGWSSGGNIAYEIATQLRALGNEVAPLVLLDQGARSSFYQSQAIKDNHFAVVEGLYGDKIAIDWQQLVTLDADDALDKLTDEVRAQKLVGTEVSEQTIRGYLEATYYLSQSMSRYQPQECDVDIQLFRVNLDGEQPRQELTLGWSALTKGKVTVTGAQGRHRSMVFEPFVDDLAASILSGLSQGSSAVAAD